MDEVDQVAFVVGLPEVEVVTEFVGDPCAERFDIGEGGGAVERGFALAQQIEIGSVEHCEGGAPVILRLRPGRG